MYHNSPRTNHAGLRLPPRSDSSPSISPTSTTPHVFPSASSSTSYDHPPPTSASFSQPATAKSARFHEALAARPAAKRHASKASVSSTDSNSYDPLDTTSPMGDRAFDAMQRELRAPPGQQGLGLVEPASMRGVASSNGYVGTSREMGWLHEDPEEYQGMTRNRSAIGGRNGDEGLPTRRYGSEHQSQDLSSGVAKPASVDLDNSMTFLLSPPTTFDNPSASTRQFAAAAASEGSSKAIPRNGRVFPAPLLLKGGGSNPSSPVFGHTAPLSIPRRPSASSGGGGSSLGSPSPGQFSARSWGQTPRIAEREREGPMGPPSSASMSSGDTSRSSLPYQRHRSQQSSTSSISQGSYLPYNSSYSYTNSNPANMNRHHNNTSSSTTSTSSPALGSMPAHPVPSSSSTSLSAMGPPLVPPPNIPHPVSTVTGTSSSDPPMSSQALLLHVHSLRSAASPMALSQSQGPLPRAPAPLLAQQNHQRIRSAGSSGETEPTTPGLALERAPTRPGSVPRLDTVDLSHKRIADVPIEVVEELKDEVEKLALGYNLLKDLPSYFIGFGSRLKYLNVRVNLLTTFPAVLCEMPSIEILDISRNKIRKLPQNPGTLVNLKVFSIAKNRVKRLPTWFTSMTHLKVLKLDHNPLEWPPKEVTAFQTTGSIGGAPLSKQEEADEMQRWLPALMRWMRDNRDKEVEREREREKEKRRKLSNPPDLMSDDERAAPGAEDAARRGGMPRTESGRIRNSPSLPSLEAFARPRLRPTLTDYVPLATSSTSNSASASSGLDTLESDPSARHSRNASHSLMQSLEPAPISSLKAKKSLPDLRQSHADILAERRTGPTMGEENASTPTLPASDRPEQRQGRAERPLLPHSATAKANLPTQANLNDSPASSSTAPTPPSAGSIVRSESVRPAPRGISTTTTSNSLPPLDRAKALFATPSKTKRTEAERSTTPNDFERNSGAYFRRQSMLPASTIAKTVPVSLLQFAEAIRGILFSLSQIYAALRQFVVFASQDRLPTSVARLLGSADRATNSLINALDRFDSQSRRSLPPQSVVRQVFTTCKENVETFGQLVAGLQPQLKSLTASADIRYARTLLLMLYGSMGEIATSWSVVVPLFPPVDQDHSASTTFVLQPPTPSPTLERSVSTASSGSNGGGARLTRTRSVTRRHAGSFSVEDVQLGAVLPPADIPPVPAIPPSTSLDDVGLADQNTSSATVRARPSASSISKSSSSSSSSSKAPIAGGISLPPTLRYQDMVQNAFEQPLTPGGTGLFQRIPHPAVPDLPHRSNSSFPASVSQLPLSSASSGSLGSALPPPASTSSAAYPPSYNPHRESRQVSTLNADETFVDQADSTIQIALDVYGMLLDSFDDPNAPTSAGAIGRKRAKELTELCKAGNETTVRLKRGVERVRGGDGRGRLKFTSSDARRLGDASFDFVQTVIKFARAVKATSTEVSFAPQVREGVGQLTLATREFAKLLSQNQTSFRPTEQQSQPTSASQVVPPAQPLAQISGNGNGTAGRGDVKVRDYAMM